MNSATCACPCAIGTLATLLPGGGAGSDELFFFLVFLDPGGFSNFDDPVVSIVARNADEEAGVDADRAASCVTTTGSIMEDLMVPLGRILLLEDMS
jgi:hypothetical protein